MSEVQQNESNNNPINDQILQELEKISNLEKKQKTLFMKNAVIKNEVASIKKVLDENNLEENDDENVIEEQKISPTLTPIEKKRYQVIGEEFMKGASYVFKDIKKQQELKEKMTAQTKEAKQLKKIEDETNKDNNKKKKVSKLLMIGLAIAAVAGVLYKFKDKLESVFKDSSGLSNTFEVITNNIGSFGHGIIGQIINSMTSTISSFFSNQNGELYKMIDTFFTTTLPKSIKYAGIHVISLFSESASKSLADEVTSVTKKSSQEVNAMPQRINAQYDLAKAQRQQAMISGIAGAGTEQEINAALKNLGITSLSEDLKAPLLQLLDQRLFAGATSESEKMAIAFQENTYNVRAFMEEFAASNEEKVVNLRNRMKSGDVTDEDVELFTTIMGGHFGRDVKDQNFQNQVRNLIFNSPDVRSSLIQSAETFQTYSKKLQAGIESQKITQEARNNLKKSSAQVIDIKDVDISGAQFVEETKKIYDLVKNMVDGDIHIGETIIKETSGLLNRFLKTSFDKAIGIFSNIFNTLVQGGGAALLNEGKESDITKGSQNFKGNDTNSSYQFSDNQGQVINKTVIQKSNRPLVLVALSLDGQPMTKFASINENQTKILNVITESNNQLQKIVNSVEQVEKMDISDSKDIKAGIFKKIFEVIDSCNNNTSRINHIESYLESNDTDNNSSKDFVLQAMSS